MRRKTAKRLIAAATIAAVLTTALIFRWPSAPEYEITDLGYIKGDGYATATNNEGHVVGWTHPADPDARPTAFIWSPEKGRRSIPALEGKESRAYDINNKGQVVGYYGELANDKAPARAFIWDEETGISELGSLGNGSQATAVNNKGRVIGTSRTPAGQWHAFIWDKTNGMRDLGTLGGKHSYANDINDKGQVIGYSDLPNGQRHAFIWQEDTGMVDIGTLGGPTSGVSGINNAGRVVGAILKKNRYRPFVWDPARGMAELRVAGNKSYVKINDSGQVVGYYFTPKWLNFKERHSVFVWDPNRGAVELNLGLENVIFIVAFDINNKGQVLATVQVGPQENRVIMLTPKAGSKAADK